MGYFDIERFYDKYRVDYVIKGTNVKKGEINISCPFCNSTSNPDPSYHLGVDPERGYFSCWRNSRHRGKTLHRLLMKVANISYKEACKLLGDKQVYLQEGSFDQFLLDPDNIFNDNTLSENNDVLFPEHLRAFDNKYSCNIFYDYLVKRRFKRPDLTELVEFYGLQYAVSGRYSNRIVVPVYLENKLVAWTGRSVRYDITPRYLSSSSFEGTNVSIKDTILGFDRLLNLENDILFVTEGPFDALKVDFYGDVHGANATCLFNKTMRESQVILLNMLKHNFRKIVILLDALEKDAMMESESLLHFLGNKVLMGNMLENYKDPGELSKKAVQKLVELNR